MKKIIIFALAFVLLLSAIVSAGVLDNILQGLGISGGQLNAPITTSRENLIAQGLPGGQPEDVVDCWDSDGGINPFEGGSTNGYISTTLLEEGASKTFSDYCATVNTLIEYYCFEDSGFVQVRKIHCPEGCQVTAAGAKCLAPPVCIDNDPLQKLTKPGLLMLVNMPVSIPRERLSVMHDVSLPLGIELYSDQCIDGSNIRQFFCADGTVQSSDRYCGDGNKCMTRSVSRQMPGDKCSGEGDGSMVMLAESALGGQNMPGAAMQFGLGGEGPSGGESGDIIIGAGSNVVFGDKTFSFDADTNMFTVSMNVVAGTTYNVGGVDFIAGSDAGMDAGIDADVGVSSQQMDSQQAGSQQAGSNLNVGTFQLGALV